MEPTRDQAFDTQELETLNLLHRVIDESMRQAKLSANQAYWSFSSAILMATASALVGLIGASLILLDRSSEGSVTAAIGLASGVYSYQLSKEAGERQKQANNRLDQMLVQLRQGNEK